MPHTLWLTPMYGRMILVVVLIAAAAFYFATQTAQLPSTECATDLDCGAGGCSGQICTTAGQAPGIITTCEFREEYGCLQLTSCGCVEGACAWRNTTAYSDCLKNLTR